MHKFDARMNQEVGIGTYVPITHLNESSVFESENGMQGMVIAFNGIAFITETNAALNLAKTRLAQALRTLDEHIVVTMTTHRQHKNLNLSGTFTDPFSAQLDCDYHQPFKGSQSYHNRLYLTVCYRAIQAGKLGATLQGLNTLSQRAIKGARESRRREHTKALKNVVYQLLDKLNCFGPRILGLHDEALGYSELLSFLGLPLNAGELRRYAYPTIPTTTAKQLSACDQAISRYPLGHLGQALSTRRIYFGRDTLQFEGVQWKTDEQVSAVSGGLKARINGTPQRPPRFGAIVVIKQYAEQTAAVMLDTLLQLDGEYLLSQHFAVSDNTIALKRMKAHLTKLENVDSPAVTQTQALHDARDSVASQQISMGYHQSTLLLLADSQAALARHINQALKCYADAGMVAIQESIGLAPAFWSLIPTNLNFAKRLSLISNENFADFAPLHNEVTGYCDNNHLGSALSILETPSKTPLFFNVHTKGSPNNPSSGHTLMIGGNNSGKTVMMGFMKCQLSRYQGQSVIFDRNRGMELLVRATGGTYARLTPDAPKASQFNVFQLPDTPANRQFCREHLCQLMRGSDEQPLPATDETWAGRCVAYAYETLALKHRQLSHIVKLLPVDFPRWPQLNKWLRADGSGSQGMHARQHDGEYAYLFDNPTDCLALQDNMGFDMTHFLDHEPRHVLVSVMMYLFHRIESALDGRLMSIFLDEAWQYLDNPYFQQKLGKWLPTLRKLNCHIIAATQSPESVVNSPIRHIMLDNAATHIFFANPQAKTDVYQSGFNLSTSEYLAIRNNLPESRLMLIKQHHESMLAKLNLGHLPNALAVLSANEASVRLAEKIREQLSQDKKPAKPHEWLTQFYHDYPKLSQTTTNNQVLDP